MKEFFTAKKIIITIVCLLFTGALAFTSIWTVTNWDKVRTGFNGANLYIKEDVTNAYNDGYTDAIGDKSKYDKQITNYRDTISALQIQITQLNQTITGLQNQIEQDKYSIEQIETLNAQLAYLVSYYETLIQDYEVDGKYIVVFRVNNVAIDVQFVDSNNKVTVPLEPMNEGYSFEGWSIDGNNSVDVSQYSVNSNITFTALFSRLGYAVSFVVDGKDYDKQYVSSGAAAIPTAPHKNGYTFLGWTLNGVDIVELSFFQITSDVIFTASFQEKEWQWKSLQGFFKWGGSNLIETIDVSASSLLGEDTFNKQVMLSFYLDGWGFDYPIFMSVLLSENEESQLIFRDYAVDTGKIAYEYYVTRSGNIISFSVVSATGLIGVWSVKSSMISVR